MLVIAKVWFWPSPFSGAAEAGANRGTNKPAPHANAASAILVFMMSLLHDAVASMAAPKGAWPKRDDV